jgi:hypothetical protein
MEGQISKQRDGWMPIWREGDDEGQMRKKIDGGAVR